LSYLASTTATVVLANLLCGRIVSRFGEWACMAAGQALFGALSLILGKLAAYPRRNGLAWALKEIGKIERFTGEARKPRPLDIRK